MLRRLLHFVSNMDAKAWLTALIMFLLAGGVGFIFIVAIGALGFKGEALVEQWLGFAAHSPYALVIAVGVFAVLAFAGVPQVVLIAAAVVAFGPWMGAAYSWVGTMVSACIGFALGRGFGARLIRNYGGEGVNKFIGLIGRNGFLASLVVRLVPAAPFVAVNMAGGATPMKFRAFLAGTAIGIVPKIVLTATAGNSVVNARQGALVLNLLVLAAVLAIWLGAGLMARKWIKQHEAALEEAPEE